MKNLKSYRAEIDQLDEQIIKLLRKRYDIIEEVADLKAREGIASTIPERVEEVRENAAKLAGELNLDEEFIRDLYSRLIRHSCETEEAIIQSAQRRKKAS